MDAIPKMIHYCWFGNNPQPELMKECMASWRRFLPDYELVEWNENSFDLGRSRYAREANEVRKFAFVSDFVRLAVLHEHGGIYMDTDVEVTKNLDRFLLHRAFSGFEDATRVPTGIIGSRVGNPWIGRLLQDYDDRIFLLDDGTLDQTTNVETITRITAQEFGLRLDGTFQDLHELVTFYPTDYFCPKDYRSGNISMTPNTHAIHHFNASWKSPHDKLSHAIHQRRQRVKLFRPDSKAAALIAALDTPDGTTWLADKVRERLRIPYRKT